MPPVTLSRQQFLSARPKGSYQSYLQYINKRRPSVPSVPGVDATKVVSRGGGVLKNPPRPVAAKPAAGPLSYASLLNMVRGSFQTPAQMEAQAARMATTSQKAQQDLLTTDYKTAQDDALRRMLAFQSAGRAAAAMNSELMGQVGAGYTGAASNLGAMGGALGAAAAGATAADVAAANQSLANVGAPSVNVGGPVGQAGIAGEQQLAVENLRNVGLPSNQLLTSGLAQQTGMAGLIGSQNLRATQEAQAAYMSSMREAQSNKTAALLKLAQGRPELAQGYLDKLQDNQRQAIALASSLLGAGFQQRMTGKKFAQDVKTAGQRNQQWWANFRNEKAESTRTY